ncbi:hypothetical protein H2198_001166 [Neophaeococcomyces mojaviensis]|uniref:Uncharacterized protein n=1 Tax=Neophaeococcomyces mojaviensis TaxID=3383035 RepID=A0ACC3AHZ7_9EURO|nr:hypothetical protein H2198_001166 [Knufia sp. JES_112]
MAPRIAIFGAGSIGAAYGWIFSRTVPDQNIVTICRSNYDVASQHGFTLNSTIFGSNLNYRPTVVRSGAEAAGLDPTTPYDYVVICSKAISSKPSTAELLQPLISNSTTIVLIQNGIGIEDEYAKLYPNNPVLSTVVYFAATQTAPAVIKHTEIELLHVGTYPAKAPAEHKKAATKFVNLVADCGATARYHDDVQSERWAKLVMNACLNPICALSKSRDMQFLASAGEDAEQFMRDTMEEVASVAQACGYSNITSEVVDRCIYRTQTRVPPGVEPSMMADALVGRNMEVDAIVGNVVKLAREKGVKVPILRTLYNLLQALDDSFSRDSHKRR